jgi:hypothetical protein
MRQGNPVRETSSACGPFFHTLNREPVPPWITETDEIKTRSRPAGDYFISANRMNTPGLQGLQGNKGAPGPMIFATFVVLKGMKKRAH